MKINLPKLGGLFFDELKIWEGLLFDRSSWNRELIVFTDIYEGNKTNTPLDNLATYVLSYKPLEKSFF